MDSVLLYTTLIHDVSFLIYFHPWVCCLPRAKGERQWRRQWQGASEAMPLALREVVRTRCHPAV